MFSEDALKESGKFKWTIRVFVDAVLQGQSGIAFHNCTNYDENLQIDSECWIVIGAIRDTGKEAVNLTLNREHRTGD